MTRKGERGDVNRANESEVETRTIESQDEREASEREQVHSVWTIECERASNVQRVFSLYQREECDRKTAFLLRIGLSGWSTFAPHLPGRD